MYVCIYVPRYVCTMMYYVWYIRLLPLVFPLNEKKYEKLCLYVVILPCFPMRFFPSGLVIATIHRYLVCHLFTCTKLCISDTEYDKIESSSLSLIGRHIPELARLTNAYMHTPPVMDACI